MRIIRLLLAVVLFIPITSFAEENQFIEHQYILGNHNPERYDNIEEGCEWATPFIHVPIVNGGTSELRAVLTSKEDGKIRKEGATVGELWLCIGDISEREHPTLGMMYERALVFHIELDGETYAGVGAWSPKTQAHFPEEGMDIWGGGALLFHMNDGAPGPTAGAMSYLILSDYYGTSRYDSGAEGLVFYLRLFEERNFERENAVDALKEIL